MKNKKLNKIRHLITLILLSIILLSGCKEDDITEPKENPPEMPPVTSMSIDFNTFPASSSLAKLNNEEAILTSANWGWASFNAVVWQTLVTAGMIVPVAAFGESFNHEAEKQSDGTWLWQYEFTPVTGIIHTATLKAIVDNSGVNWEMYITKENLYEDFLWFSGQSDLLATEGTWTINFEPNNPTPWLGIEWNRNPEESTADIKYTNIVPGGNENGGYISYGIVDDTEYDAFYEIFNKGKDNTISINWNRETHAGQVRDSVHYGDYNWHCWDENLEDVDCL